MKRESLPGYSTNPDKMESSKIVKSSVHKSDIALGAQLDGNQNNTPPPCKDVEIKLSNAKSPTIFITALIPFQTDPNTLINMHYNFILTSHDVPCLPPPFISASELFIKGDRPFTK